MQNTSQVLMIRPVNFGYNAETAVNNSFQVSSGDTSTHSKAVEEFDRFTEILRREGVDVNVIQDSSDPHTPDSIFPNNWISFHENKGVLLYPMYAINRRAERKLSVIRQLQNKYGFAEPTDLTGYENDGSFLEGTGSMVLDRDNSIAYACLSPRTSLTVLDEFCRIMDYRAVVFNATDDQGRDIYHTNVLMCVADRFVVICLDCITDTRQRELVVSTIKQTGKELIEITIDQLNKFAGNMLQLVNIKGEKLLVMSTRAYHSLNQWQLDKLNSYNRIVHSSLETIENNGGGSARCMIAEVFYTQGAGH